MFKSKRLFLAINLPLETKRELFGIQKEINSQLDEQFFRAGVFKWVAMENLHLTLKFIGDVKEEKIPEIIEEIGSAVKKQEPFEIKTKAIDYDNEKKDSRFIWLTIEKNRQLEGLAKSLDEKHFLGHITLARIKEWIFKRIEDEEKPKIDKVFEKIIPVNSIELTESILKKTGPEYIIIKSFNLPYSKP